MTIKRKNVRLCVHFTIDSPNSRNQQKKTQPGFHGFYFFDSFYHHFPKRFHELNQEQKP